jgi:uncharacterized Zn finger protein (UPF0148 family)
MDDHKHSRSLSMICSTCGGSQFEHDPEDADGPARCAGCDRVFGREELIRENQARIDETVDEVKAEIVRDLHQTFRDAFKGSKHFKLK